MARNKYPEVTVHRILDVALQLFLEKGYDHTTIQDIVNALGDLSKGAIYHHFKSKEEIIEAVAERLYEDADREMKLLLQSKEGTGLERLHRLVMISLKNPGQNKLLNAAPNIMNNPRFLVEHLKNGVADTSRQVFAPLIQSGVEDGSISGDPQLLAEILVLLLDIWLNPSIFSYTKEAFQIRYQYLQHLLEQQGLPLLDGEIYEEMEKYRTLMKEQKEK